MVAELKSWVGKVDRHRSIARTYADSEAYVGFQLPDWRAEHAVMLAASAG